MADALRAALALNARLQLESDMRSPVCGVPAAELSIVVGGAGGGWCGGVAWQTLWQTRDSRDSCLAARSSLRYSYGVIRSYVS